MFARRASAPNGDNAYLYYNIIIYIYIYIYIHGVIPVETRRDIINSIAVTKMYIIVIIKCTGLYPTSAWTNRRRGNTRIV